jgi:hypothetical protein
MKAKREGLSCDSGTSSFYGKRQRKLNCVACVTLKRDKRQLGLHLKAGLTIFKDRVRHGEIFYEYFTSTLRYSSCDQSIGWEADSKAVHTEDGPLDLIIEATALAYVLSYRNSQGEAVKIGLLDSIEMTGRDFTGPIFGLFAQIDGGIIEDPDVAFSGFSIKELSDVD